MKIVCRQTGKLDSASDYTAIFISGSKHKDIWLNAARTLHGVDLDRWLSSPEFQRDEDSLIVLRPAGGPRRLALVKLGEEPEGETVRRAAARVIRSAMTTGVHRVSFCVSPDRTHVGPRDGWVEWLVEGALLANYQYDRYKTDAGTGAKISLLTLDCPAAFARSSKERISNAIAIGSAVRLARDLANTPPNDMTPAHLASEAASISRRHKIRCTVMNRRKLVSDGFGGILSVGGGSSNDPHMIVMDYRPAKRTNRRPIVLIGKGVTFDAGGISIKPATDMDRMKFDMSGGAFVVGVMSAIALLKVPVHVVGIVPAAENVLGSNAYRPGDIVRMYSGKTVEIINTDAEGRLLLADALAFAHKYKPEAVVDIATLTGHCVVALGSHAAGLFTTSSRLRNRIMDAAIRTGERVWELPLYAEHEKAMRSNVADLKNSGGRPAGASTAAAFLKAFAGEYPWAHLDIAGTAYTDEDTPYASKGTSTGYGIRLLVAMLQAWVSSK